MDGDGSIHFQLVGQLLHILGDVEPHVIFEILPQLDRVKDPEVFPATSTTSGRFCNPKLFENEANIRRRC